MKTIEINIYTPKEIVTTAEKTKEETVKKTSKVEEIAKNTYKEINSKVNDIIKNKDSFVRITYFQLIF